MEKIQLTDQEKEVIQKQIRGEITQFSATDEERELLTGVIEKAENLLDDLDEYDTMCDDLIVWFWSKYQSQEK